MSRIALVAVAALAATLTLASPAAAQKVVFSVPGIMNTSTLATYFSCTAVGTSATVTVEAFQNTGTQTGSATTTIAANNSVMFGTSSSAGLSVDQILGSSPIGKGYAQIVSTSASLICAAYIAEVNGAPPTTMVSLPVLKKTKQKGD
jgi:hypothetical protein